MPENKKFWKFCNQAGNKVELLLYGDISQTSWWGDEVTPKQFAEELAGLGALDTDDMFGYFSYDTEFSPTWQGDTGGNPDTPGGGDGEDRRPVRQRGNHTTAIRIPCGRVAATRTPTA